ncbi:MAG: hypothetical protein KAX80_11630 [Planctomycetes bacterium]|nr:hypothetical protein [Planctomycetota bacterium]
MALRIMTWDTDLMDYVSSVLDEPFEWGRTDCASLVRGAVGAMYGHDVLKVGRYKTLAGARRTLKLVGSYKDALAHAGAEEVPIGFRQRGDVAILPDTDVEGFPGLGVVVRGGMLTVGPEEIVRIVPIDEDSVVMRFPNG